VRIRRFRDQALPRRSPSAAKRLSDRPLHVLKRTELDAWRVVTPSLLQTRYEDMRPPSRLANSMG
jgi:hypothetical protein